MPEGKLEAPPTVQQLDQATMQRLLDFVHDERKQVQQPLRKNQTDDQFLRFNDVFSRRDRSADFFGEFNNINDLLAQRSDLESRLNTDQKDELRRARRDYAAAQIEKDREKYGREIEQLVPGSADINAQIRSGLGKMNSVSTMRERNDPQECFRCHPAPKRPAYDPNYSLRTGAYSDYESFFKPRHEDRFEARWAQMAMESPMVKLTEAIKELPAMKLSVEDPAKVAKMAMTVAGVDMNGQITSMIDKTLGGVKSFSKEGGNRFVIEREGRVNLEFPQKTPIAAGMKLSGLELDSMSFTLGNSKYPEIKDLKGLKVKLEVPGALSALGVGSEAEIKRIYFERQEGSGDFAIKAEVVNPVAWATRKIAARFVDGVPEGDTIIAPIATIGPDGKPK